LTPEHTAVKLVVS